MIYVNDDRYTDQYFQQCFEQFENIPSLSHCRGRRLAVCLPDTALWIALCLYLKRKGGSLFPIHQATPLDAAKRLAHRAECHTLFFHDITAPVSISDKSDDPEGLFVQMSSGTTGEPKVIVRSWKSIELEIEAYVATFTAAATMTPVVACPVTHSYGLICGVLVALKRQRQPVIVTQINPKYLMRKCLNTQQSLLYASPTLINTLVQLLPGSDRLYAVMTSGAVMPKPWFESLQCKAMHVFQQYGCSEAGCVAISQSLQAANEMGQPLPHLKISAGDAQHPAEILVCKEGKTINTQDLGYLDSQGNLFFIARIDDTINVAGLNVYPQEVEDIFLEHPLISEAVVFKKPDTYAGERVCVKFVASESLDLTQLRLWFSKNLAPHQMPIEFTQVTEIPRLPNGKINRKNLAQSTEACITALS